MLVVVGGGGDGFGGGGGDGDAAVELLPPQDVAHIFQPEFVPETSDVQVNLCAYPEYAQVPLYPARALPL